ncbi:type I secretion C-terminal target domain-containing protein [Aeromonas sp. 107A]
MCWICLICWLAYQRWGTTKMAAVLINYLQFNTTTKTLTIDPAGAGGEAELTIQFQNTLDLASLGSNQDIIKQLLDDGNLKVDI